MSDKVCTHRDQIKDFPPQNISVCEECVKLGDSWVNLRQCLTCGHVGCCDSSKNTHATRHFKATKHPIMKSVTPGEEFTWCYVDEMMIDDVPAK